MLRRSLIIVAAFIFAFGILFTSILRTAAVRYEFTGQATIPDSRVLGDSTINIDYYLAYPGNVLPDSPLWKLKALRDRIWLTMTTNRSKKVELNILFADKRIGSSLILFNNGKADVAFSTLTKAEKYLEEASNLAEQLKKEGANTIELNTRLAKASLKHFSVMDEILKIAPDDAKPGIIQTQSVTKLIYEKSRNSLNEQGGPSPENPFDWR
jgi:hypothetical protein